LITPLSLALCTLYALSGPKVGVDAEGVDAAAVQRGLGLRVSADRLDGWVIEVDPGPDTHTYSVSLTAPGGSPTSRTLVLEGETDEDRSRALASRLALIIDAWEDPQGVVANDDVVKPVRNSARGTNADEPAKAPESVSEEDPDPMPPRKVRGLLEGGFRLGLGQEVEPSYGLEIAGGLSLVRDIIQPRIQLSWSRSVDEVLTTDGIRVGAGLAAGHALGTSTWLGATIVPHAMWVQARDRGSDSIWVFSGEAAALFRAHVGPAFLGLKAGVDIQRPAVRARGSTAAIRWKTVRFVSVLSVGLRI
jgi:hypothetical protein